MNIVETMCVPEKAALFASPSGDRYKEQFVGKYNENGDIVLVSVGKIDIYDEIQSHAGEADINNLIRRAEAGDLSAFTSAVFGDFTDMPTSYAEALNVVISAEREFNHLPQEIKDKFDNDWHKYITTAGSESWLNAFKKDDIEKQVSQDMFEKEVSEDVKEQ